MISLESYKIIITELIYETFYSTKHFCIKAMTPESRILKSIHSARSESAWSPMPEHLLFLQMETDRLKTPATPGTGVNTCDDCGMTFKTEAMLTYHKIGFCVGNAAEEYPPLPQGLPDEETILLKEGKSSLKTLPREGTPAFPREGTPAEVSKRQSTQVFFLPYLLH